MDGGVCCLPRCEDAQGLTLRLTVCSEEGEQLAGILEILHAKSRAIFYKLWLKAVFVLYFGVS